MERTHTCFPADRSPLGCRGHGDHAALSAPFLRVTVAPALHYLSWTACMVSKKRTTASRSLCRQHGKQAAGLVFDSFIHGGNFA